MWVARNRPSLVRVDSVFFRFPGKWGRDRVSRLVFVSADRRWESAFWVPETWDSAFCVLPAGFLRSAAQQVSCIQFVDWHDEGVVDEGMRNLIVSP